MIGGWGRYVAKNLPPVAWWRNDVAPNPSCPDLMRSGNALVTSVTPALVNGYGQEMKGGRHTADGMSQTPHFLTPTRTWTVAAWLKYEAQPQTYVQVIQVDTNDRYFTLSVLPGQTYLTRTGGGNIGTGGPAVAASTAWRLWVFCGAVNDTRFYVDGSVGLSSSDTHDITGGSGNMQIDVGQNGNNGAAVSVGDVVYWNRQLSAGEVSALWAARDNPDIYAEAASPMVT